MKTDRFVKISPPELGDGTMYPVNVSGVVMLLIRAKGKYYAASNDCPVRPQKLSAGKLEDTTVICPDGHHFDLRTGRAHGHGTTVPVISRLFGSNRLRTYKVETKGDDVWIESPLKERAMEILAGIKKIEEEHAHFRELYAKRVEVMKELEVLKGTQTGGPESIAARVAEGRKRVEDLLAVTDESLGRHFAMEEKVLAPVIGETLIRGLHVEHDQIWGLFRGTRQTLGDIWRTAKAPGEMAAAIMQLEHTIDEFARAMEVSALGEESIMNMAKRAVLRGE